MTELITTQLATFGKKMLYGRYPAKKLYKFMIYLLILLLQVSISFSYEQCSRRVSRMVRTRVELELFPLLQNGSFGIISLEKNCPFIPLRDVFYLEASQREEVDGKNYCPFCGKAFMAERFLDAHMAHRHNDKIPVTADVCLDQYCEIFMCELAGDESLKSEFLQHPCINLHMEELKDTCEQHIRGCILNDTQFAFVSNAVCGQLHCEKITELNNTVTRSYFHIAKILFWIFNAVCIASVFIFYVYSFFSRPKQSSEFLLPKRNKVAYTK